MLKGRLINLASHEFTPGEHARIADPRTDSGYYPVTVLSVKRVSATVQVVTVQVLTDEHSIYAKGSKLNLTLDANNPGDDPLLGYVYDRDVQEFAGLVEEVEGDTAIARNVLAFLSVCRANTASLPKIVEYVVERGLLDGVEASQRNAYVRRAMRRFPQVFRNHTKAAKWKLVANAADAEAALGIGAASDVASAFLRDAAPGRPVDQRRLLEGVVALVESGVLGTNVVWVNRIL